MKKNQIIIYSTSDGKTKIRVDIDTTKNTVWLSQMQMAELFQTTVPNINLHIKNLYDEGELEQEATIKDFLIVQNEGGREVKRKINCYNLDVIISVGYRVKSLRGTQFRIWATQILHEYIKKGFAMNDELLKQAGGGDYFKELLDRIRDIRSSEKVFYRQVLDLFATSMDYDSKSEVAVKFFQEMQNKLHFAIHGHTAPEIIVKRADADKPFMGLQSFKGEKPQKSEVLVAKNYLNENEIKGLNLMVSAYLDIAEMKAHEKTPMYMKDWVEELEGFISYRGKKLLDNLGKVSREDADKIANEEYDKYIKKSADELTQVEKDMLEVVRNTYTLLEKKSKN